MSDAEDIPDYCREFRDRNKMPPKPQVPLGRKGAIHMRELQECFNDVTDSEDSEEILREMGGFWNPNTLYKDRMHLELRRR
jgi:hypothetical protein